MADWNATDVRAVAPEFTATADGTVNLWIDYAEPQVSEDAFGDNYKLAGIFLTAHLLTLFAPSSSGSGSVGVGPVTQRSVGAVSVSYAAPQLSNSALSAGLGLTKYGVQYAQMIRNCALTPQVL